MRIVLSFTAAGLMLMSSLSAQTAVDSQNQLIASTANDPTATAKPALCCTIPALTEIQFEFLSTINSQANHIGEQFAIKLAEPITIDGKELVPVGTVGSGEIIHASKSSFGGKAGELILAARYLDYKGVRIPLRSLRYTKGRGTDRGDLSAAVAIAGGAVGGVVALFITGGEVNIPVGTKAFAKTATDTTLAPAEAENSANAQQKPEGTTKQ